MPRWTKEARKKQRERAIKSKIWNKSTGPKTAEGKKIAAQNALKHGMYTPEVREISKFLWLQKRYVRAIMERSKNLE